MELVLLTVPDCPNAAAFEARLAAAMVDQRATVIRRRVIADEEEAAAAGMLGWPTLLVDGCGPFAMSGLASTLS